MPDTHRVAPIGTPDPIELSDMLRSVLLIHGLALSDRERVQQLIEDTERAGGLGVDPSAAAIDVYVERMQRVLQQADEIVAKYAVY